MRRLALVVLLLAVVLATTGGTAFGALPRTYKVTTIDNPTPQTNERFGDGFVNGGE